MANEGKEFSGNFSLDDLYATGLTANEIKAQRDTLSESSGLINMNQGDLSDDAIDTYFQSRNADIPMSKEVAPVQQAEARNDLYGDLINAVESTKQSTPETMRRVVDGDTVHTSEHVRSLRLGWINTPESVHVNSDRNTPEGKVASNFAKDMLPEGSETVVHDYGADQLGREVAGIDTVIDGVPIDYQIVAMDNEMSTYYTDHGEHVNPALHDQYKAYYSKYTPYQYGQMTDGLLSDADMEYMRSADTGFQETYKKFQNGEASREELNKATVAMYKDPAMVAKYRQTLANWDNPDNSTEGTVRGAISKAMENDPNLRKQYNQAVKAGHLADHYIPEENVGFWEELYKDASTSIRTYTDIAGGMDFQELRYAREHKVDIDYPIEALTEQVPPKYQALIQQEYATYGSNAAITLTEQLTQELADNEYIDDMGLVAQLGFGTLAYALSPSTYLGGAAAVPTGKAILGANKAWQVSRAVAGKNAIKGSEKVAKLTAWTVGGAVSGLPVNAPRLSSDQTYSANDLLLDTLFDAGFGAAGGTLVDSASAIYRRNKTAREISDARIKEQEAFVENIDETGKTIEPEEPVNYVESVDSVLENSVEDSQVLDIVEGDEIREVAVQYRPVTQVSTEGLRTAWATVKKKFNGTNTGVNGVGETVQEQTKDNVGYLVNSVLGTGKRVSTEAEQKLLTGINADVTKLLAQYPNGQVPMNVQQEIKDLMYGSTRYKRVNAVEQLTRGDATEATLKEYREVLNAHGLLDDTIPMSNKDFRRQLEDSLSVREDIGDSLSIWRDFAEAAKDMPDSAARADINGAVWKAYNKMLDGTLEKSPIVKRNKPTVALSPREIQAKLKEAFPDGSGKNPEYKKEWDKLGNRYNNKTKASMIESLGIRPFKDEYYKKMESLKGEVQQVSKEVQEIGEVVEFYAPKQHNEYEVVESAENKGKERSTDESADDQRVRVMRDEGRALTSHGIRDVIDARKVKYNKEHGTNVVPDTVVGRWKDELTLYGTDALENGDVKAERAAPTESTEQRTYQDLLFGEELPRNISVTPTKELFRKPTEQNLRMLQERIAPLVKGVKDAERAGKVEANAQTERIRELQKALLTDKSKVVSDMVKSRDWAQVEAVLQAAQANHDVRKSIVKEGETAPTVLNEEEMIQVIEAEEGSVEVPQETIKEIEVKIEGASKKMLKDSVTKMAQHLTKFVSSGEKALYEEGRKPSGVLDVVGRMAAKITEDVGTKFQNSKLTSLEYVGSRITEIGKGYGGRVRRNATGGLIRHATLQESLTQVLPQYVRVMDDYAASKGVGAVGKLAAQQMAGSDSKIVAQFNKDFFTLLEMRRQGRDANVHQSVKDFADQWEVYMDSNHTKLVDAGIQGFTKERKIKHYVPHVWKAGKLKQALADYGEEKVIQLFAQSYRTKQGVNVTKARELAARQLKWIKSQDGADIDQLVPTIDSRARERLDLDTTTEIDGLSIMDLLDTEVAGIAVKYSNRTAGWVGLSKSTDGAITSQLDIDVLKQQIIQEGKEKGIATGKYEQFYDDTIDAMFGRPTSGSAGGTKGLATELRELKDLTALTRMGGLGSAQAIETGQVVTRSILNLFSDPDVARRVFAVAGESADNKSLIREIQSISSLTNDMEFLQRQSVHLDQAELDDINAVRKLSLWIADKGTAGKLKAPASRLLGKVSGYNAVRRIQSRVVQASFTLDVAKHFKDRSGKMSTKRLADLGLTDTNGKDIDLQRAFDEHVEFDDDGNLVRLNADKWDTKARDKFQYAMLRDEAQQIQQTLVGELPPWMNRPLMALVFQFRQMPIVANNKQLSRSMAFGDKEAVTAVALNTAIAGLVRYSKFALLGVPYAAITGNEVGDVTSEQTQISKYIAAGGVYPDAADFVLSSSRAWDSYKEGNKVSGLEQFVGQVPVMGLAGDYVGLGKSVADDDRRKLIDSAFGLMPLGNTAIADQLNTSLHEVFDK